MTSILLACILALLPKSPDSDRIRIETPSIAQEVEMVWSTLRDIKFFEEHNYSVSLPSGQLIDELKKKGRQGKLGEADYSRLESFMHKHVYKVENYQKSRSIISAAIPTLLVFLQDMESKKWDWDIAFFPTYRIQMTLYGPGGSYHPDDGSIVIFTTPDGRFKQYNDPTNTLIHEMVHLCIEESIIQTYQVPHSLKERLVDRFVKISYGDKLPEYRIQPMGDTDLDQFVTSNTDLQNLASIVEEFMKK